MKELNALGSAAERQAIPSTVLRHSENYHLPDAKGHFGQYGGSFVSETLTLALTELREAYAKFSQDPSFLQHHSGQ